jgi:hypothetical protein
MLWNVRIVQQRKGFVHFYLTYTVASSDITEEGDKTGKLRGKKNGRLEQFTYGAAWEYMIFSK